MAKKDEQQTEPTWNKNLIKTLSPWSVKIVDGGIFLLAILLLLSLPAWLAGWGDTGMVAWEYCPSTLCVKWTRSVKGRHSYAKRRNETLFIIHY
jgi:hypothetical protein